MRRDIGGTKQSQQEQELRAYASAFVLHALHDVWKVIFREILTEQSQGGTGSIDVEKTVHETNKRHALVVDSLFTGALSHYFNQREHGNIRQALKDAGISKQDRDVLVVQTARKPGYTMQSYIPTEVDLEPRANYLAAKREVAALHFILALKEKVWSECLVANAEKMLATDPPPSGQALLAAADAEYARAIEAIYSGRPHELVEYAPETITTVLAVSGVTEAEVRDLDTSLARKSAASVLNHLTPPDMPKTQVGATLAAEGYRINLEVALGVVTRTVGSQVTHERLDVLSAQYLAEEEALFSLIEKIEMRTNQQQPDIIATTPDTVPNQPHQIDVQNIDRPSTVDWHENDWQQALREELRKMLENTGLSPLEEEQIIKDFSIAQYNKKYFDQPEALLSEIQQTYIILSMLNGVSNPSQRLGIFQEGCSKNGAKILLGNDERAEDLATWLQTKGQEEYGAQQGKKQVSSSITVAYDERSNEYVATIKIRDDSLLDRVIRAIVSFLNKHEVDTGVRPVDKFVDRVRGYATHKLNPLEDASIGGDETSVQDVKKARSEAISQLYEMRRKEIHEHKDVIKEIIEKRKPQEGKRNITHGDDVGRTH